MSPADIPDAVLDQLALGIAHVIETRYPLGVTAVDVKPHVVGFLADVLGSADGGEAV
jgi:hypothetical protein